MGHYKLQLFNIEQYFSFQAMMILRQSIRANDQSNSASKTHSFVSIADFQFRCVRPLKPLQRFQTEAEEEQRQMKLIQCEIAKQRSHNSALIKRKQNALGVDYAAEMFNTETEINE